MSSPNLRAFGLLAVFGSWPFGNFIAQNVGQLTTSDFGVVGAAWGLALGIAGVLAWLATRVSSVSLIDAALLGAASTVLFFLHASIVAHGGVAAYAIVVPAALIGLGLALRRPTLRRPIIIFAVVSGLSPLALLAAQAVKQQLGGAPLASTAHAVWSAAPRIRPNVLHLILDGYAHSHTLSALANMDNSTFHAALKERGFVVVERAASNYPVTYLSLASTLGMEYVAMPESRYPDRQDFYTVIRGGSVAVAGLRRAGYSIVHSGSGWGGAACSGREDLCVNRNNQLRDRLGEAGYKLVRMTPLAALAGSEAAIAKRGDLDTVLNALDRMYRRAPFYLFAHSLPPHPPFYLRADCSEREATGSLTQWRDPTAYRDAILCVNYKVLALTDAILARDRDALIIFQADHGSNFHGASWAGRINAWTRPMIEERFRTFLAIRAPTSCRHWIVPDLTSVNVLRFVAGCLQQRAPDYLANRFFAAAYENDLDFGKVSEVRSPW